MLKIAENIYQRGININKIIITGLKIILLLGGKFRNHEIVYTSIDAN